MYSLKNKIQRSNNMKKVELYCDRSFTVYKELTFVDKSLDIEKAKVVATTELIRVLPTWTSTQVKIKRGNHSYDAEILKWPTIKQFISQKVIRVISGDITEDDEEQEVIKQPVKKQKTQSLEDLAPEN
jgi:hypothetical protein